MKNRLIYLIFVTFIIFTFVIFYKSLDKSVIYEPKNEIKDIPEFTTTFLFENKEVTSKKIFNQNKFYLFNIWASWCVPCRQEHPLLINLNKEYGLNIFGMNYKDNKENAKDFLNELGNPYHKVFTDLDGTIAIEWGAYGVPESYLIFDNNIVKKYVGPLNQEIIDEIKLLIK